MSDCVIKFGHPKGTPAKWVNAKIPQHTVCDHHKEQYDREYDNFGIKWRRIFEDTTQEEQIKNLTARVEKAEKALEEALAYIRGCPIHGTAACPEEYMLNVDGSSRAGYSGHWQESYRCGQRPPKPNLSKEK